MKLQHLLVGIAATLMLSTGAFARGGQHEGGRWMQQLNLTADQQARLQPIFEQKRAQHEQFRSQMEALLTPEQRAQLGSGKHGRGAWKNLNLTSDQQARMKELRQSMRSQRQAQKGQMQQQLAQVLTPEQMQQWQQHKGQRHGHHRGHHNKGGWLKKLNLTADQQARLQPIFEQQKARHAAFRSQAEAILTADQRAQLQSGGHRAWKQLQLTDDQRAQLKSLREQGRSERQAQRQALQQQLAQVLTPEQQAQMQQMRSQHHGRHRDQNQE